MSGNVAPVTRTSDLPVRAASGAAMIVLALAAIFAGGLPYLALLGAAGVLIAAEWAGLMRASPLRIGLAIAGTLAVVAALLPQMRAEPVQQLLIAAAAAGAVAGLGRSARLGVGVLYAGLPVIALVWLRDQADGVVLAFWTLAVVWATDIGAYFAGRAIGGPKLAPRLSPNKTWAGLIGGMAAALAVSFAISGMTGIPPRLAALAGVLAIAAQAGDLFESWLKRRAGVKDSGRLLPGHGGAMDRLDGVAPVACIVALLLWRGYT